MSCSIHLAFQPCSKPNLIIKWLACLLLLSLTTPVTAQNLALKSFEGVTVGWLLWKTPGTPFSSYMTPQGDILTMSNNGATSNTMQVAPKKLVYESNDCTGDAWIQVDGANTALQGEVFQIGEPEDSLHARMPHGSINFGKEVFSEKAGDGGCSAIPGGADITVIGVEEVDPLTYGITENPQGKWKVKSPSWELSTHEVLFCNGFEACQ